MAKIRKRFIIPLLCALIFLLGMKFFGAEVFTSLAVNNLEKKNYKGAVKLADTALYLEPENREARLAYIKALLGLPPSYATQKAIFDFTQSNQNDEADRLAEEKIFQWRNFALQKSGENYIQNAPMDAKVIHWDKNSFPLSVSFSQEVSVPSYYEMKARTAFDTWQRMSDGFFKFEYTNGDADIEVKFVPLGLSARGEQGHLGNPAFTTPLIENGKLKKMTIFVHDRDRHSRYYPQDAVYTFVLHEISHALGVMGHSQNANDLMYMSNMATVATGIEAGISRADLNTLYLLYTLVPDITNSTNYDTKGQIYAPVVLGSEKDIIKRKIEEAQAYIKKAPFQVSGYIDLAVLYARIEDFDSAETTLDRGMSVSKNNMEKYLIYYNLAVLYMEKGDKKGALNYAHQAQSISNNPEIQSLIFEIKAE